MTITPELADYINKSRQTGNSDNAIRKTLLNAGWNPPDVDEALSPSPIPPTHPMSNFSSSATDDAMFPTNRYKSSLLVAAIIIFTICVSAGYYYFFFNQNGSRVLNSNLANQVNEVSTSSQVTSHLAPNWNDYLDGDNGYQVTYPTAYRITDQKQNYGGTQKFLIPDLSGSGASKFLEIVDPLRHNAASPHEFSYSLLGTSPITSIQQFDSIAVDHLIPSLNKNGYTLTSAKTTLSGQDAYKIILVSQDDGKTKIGVYLIYRPNYIYKIEYSPVGDSNFEKILSSFKFITVTKETLSDQTLYVSAEANKDATFCDHIRDGGLKKNCYIAVRGKPIIDEIPIDFGSIPTNSSGDSKIVNGVISLSVQKGSNSWVAGGITIGKEGWDGVSFDADLINGERSQSLLTVYLNTTEIGMVDGRVASPGKQHYTFSFPPNTNPGGLYSLSFRLDDFADGITSAVVSNIAGVRVH